MGLLVFGSDPEVAVKYVSVSATIFTSLLDVKDVFDLEMFQGLSLFLILFHCGCMFNFPPCLMLVILICWLRRFQNFDVAISFSVLVFLVYLFLFFPLISSVILVKEVKIKNVSSNCHV